MTYHVEAERHVGQPVQRRGAPTAPILFRYAVKRQDGSVCFRAASKREADEIAWNLNNPERDA